MSELLETSYLGIEFGSTNIKAVLIDAQFKTIAIGSYTWENQLIDSIWTYSLDDAWKGLQKAYQNLNEQVFDKFGKRITTLKGIGVSGMMHGYLVFDKQNQLLTNFRTWRNTMTGEASNELSHLFNFHIPERWSIAHLYQAILNNETHVNDIAHMTTLAGYVHWQLTGQKTMGIGEASGMFPIDSTINNYDQNRISQFDQIVSNYNYSWKLNELLPTIIAAGNCAGTLTEEGAKLLDPSGLLQPGVRFCPPEGDAQTGMVATNAVTQNMGNVSAGTSVFAMIVLDKQLSAMYKEIDLVTTPQGYPVAMVHCNNCTSDINAWVEMLIEYNKLLNQPVDLNDIYTKLYSVAFEGDSDCGGLLNYNYLSGEHITNIPEGRPLFVRLPNSKLTLANFMKTHVFSALCSLKVGLDIFKQENIQINSIVGHGGFFKTKNVGQRAMAAVIEAPVGVTETAAEGGPYGMALLAAYLDHSKHDLSVYLNQVFADQKVNVLHPQNQDIQDFNEYYERFKLGLTIEQSAIENLKVSE